MLKKFPKILLFLILAVFLVAGSAYAINWVESPDGNVLVFGHTINVGVNQAGSSEFDPQPAGMFGAGFTMYGTNGGAIMHAADLHTYDAYTPYNPVTQTGGYWDVFAVNVNTVDFLWNLSGLTDPINVSAPGITEFWGGSTEGGLEHFWDPNFDETIILTSGIPTTFYISFVLSTNLDPDSDEVLPSWGSLYVSPVPEPSTMLLFGTGLLGLAALGRKRLFKK